MFKVLEKNEINVTRQHNLDLLKVIATVAMVLFHAVMQFGAHIDGYWDDGAFIFGVTILGTYVAVAHAFMFCMGVGITYSRKNTPKDLFKRGVWLYIAAYILNFFRYSVWIVAEGLLVGAFRNELWYSLYIQDILHFAGLAMMTTALFKKLKLNSIQILVISMIMSIFGSVIALTSTGNKVWDVILGSFYSTTRTDSHFALINWYIFVALGIFFGDVLRRTENLNRFYSVTMIISGAVMAVYLVLTKHFGFYFLTKDNFYYAVSIPEAAGLMSIDLFLASTCYFMIKNVDKSKLTVFINTSKNVNSIYAIHWCIIGFIDAVICYMLGVVFPYWMSYFLGCAIVIVSYMLSMCWEKLRYRGKYVK